MKSFNGLFKSAMLIVVFVLSYASQLLGSEDIIIEREGVQLKGNFHVAQGTGKFPTVVLLSGFPGGRTDVLGIGKLLAGAGINVLTFQYCGTYESQESGLHAFHSRITMLVSVE